MSDIFVFKSEFFIRAHSRKLAGQFVRMYTAGINNKLNSRGWANDPNKQDFALRTEEFLRVATEDEIIFYAQKEPKPSDYKKLSSAAIHSIAFLE